MYLLKLFSLYHWIFEYTYRILYEYISYYQVYLLTHMELKICVNNH